MYTPIITKTRARRNLHDFNAEVLTDNVITAPYEVKQTSAEQWEITINRSSVQVTVRAGKMRITNQPWSFIASIERGERDYREQLEGIYDELLVAWSPFSRGALGSGREVVTLARGLGEIRERLNG